MPSAPAITKTKNKPLTSQEMVFLERYLLHFNGNRAAQEAGYAKSNPDNARTAAYELLHKPYIRRAIDDRMRMVCMETNEALARLAAIARGDVMDFLSEGEDGVFHVDLKKADEKGITFLIKSYTMTRDGPQLELYSAMEALDRICKHLNILKQPDTQVNVSLTAWATFVTQAREKAGIDLNAPLPLNAGENINNQTIVDSAFVDAMEPSLRVVDEDNEESDESEELEDDAS